MSMIKEKIRILKILPYKNIPTVLLKLIRRIFTGSLRKVKVFKIDADKIDQVFDSISAQLIAELFDSSGSLENFDEIPIFGNPNMKLKLTDLMKGNWTDIYPMGNFDPQLLKDRRFIWEVSRLQFLPLMAKCICYSDSETMKSKEKRLLNTVSSWSSANRFPTGVNWENPLEAAIRSINILAAGAILSKRNVLNNDLKEELSELLCNSYGYIKNNLEHGDGLPSNHFIVEVCILYMLSKAFLLNETSAMTLALIKKTLTDQISEDGLLLESSLPYASFVLEAYLLFLLIYVNDKEVDERILNRVGKMYSALISMVGKNLIVPAIGDDDSARILRFDSISTYEPSRKDYLTSIYNNIFSDRVKIAKKPNVSTETEAAKLSLDREAGFGFLRKGLCRIVFRFPGNREFRLGSHCHSDYLSFCLYYGDDEIFGDPGSFLYSDSYSRAIFRTEESHNAIKIRDYPQRKYFKSPFMSCINDRMRWDLSGAGDDGVKCVLLFEGKQNRYVRTERDYFITESYLKIDDCVYSNIPFLNIKWSFILSPYLEIVGVDEEIYDIKSIHIVGKELKIVFKVPNVFNVSVEEIMYSRYYGQEEPAKRIILIPRSNIFNPSANRTPVRFSFEVHLRT